MIRSGHCGLTQVAALTMAFAALSTGLSAAERPVVDVEAPFAPVLSAYGLFADPARQIPHPGLIPYDVIAPLFSDYSDKHRFVLLPEGEAAEYRESGAFAFPVGTVLVKTFSYPVDMRNPSQGRRLIETRLLVHRKGGWDGVSYAWNDEQTDARLAVAGKRVDVSWIHTDGAERATQFLVPNMNQCKHCHRATGAVVPLGTTARQLNRDIEYTEGVCNQLAYWAEHGHLVKAPATEHSPRFGPWDDESANIHERALVYLDVNCSHCHNPAGLASGTRLDLRYEQHEPWLRGVLKRPTAAGWAAGDLDFAIVPGFARRSFLLHRMNSADPTVRMPPTGRTIIHDEGVALIREWIDTMNPVENLTLGGD